MSKRRKARRSKASGRARVKCRVQPLSAAVPSRGPVAVYELAISEEIGWNTTAASVREQLSVAGEDEELLIRINSAGGFVTEGMAIYAAIRRHKGKTVAIVEGIAASMASVILQAANKRLVCKGSYVMIHNPWAGVQGDAEELRKQAELLDKMKGDLLDIYEARSGGKCDRKKLEELMDAETYMTAEEAVEYGLADAVDDAEAKIELRAVAKLDPKKIPESLRALVSKGPKMTKAEKKAKLAALKEEMARLKAEETEETSDEEEETEEESAEEEEETSDEETEEKEEKKEESASLLATVRRITGKKSLAEAEGALMALGATSRAAATNGRAAAVNALIKAGKLAPADKDWALKCSAKAFTAYQKQVEKLTIVGESAVQPVTKGLTKSPVSAGSSDEELTADEEKVRKAMGLTKEAMIKARTANPRTTEVK